MKLDLSALPQEQREALRAIVDGVDEALVRASRAPGIHDAVRDNCKAALRLNARVCSAIGRAERAQKKGNR